MKHILFILTSANKIGTAKNKTGYEFSEVADPYWAFSQVGYTVDFASIKGGTPPEDGYDKNHENSQLFRNSAGFKRLNFSHKLSEIDHNAYDAIFFPGGLGPMVDLVVNSVVKKVIIDFHENDKIISAVCHGSVALLGVRIDDSNFLLKDKKVTSFTEAEEIIKKHELGRVIPFLLDRQLKTEGAIFIKNKPFESHVIVDNKLITGQNPASATAVASEVIKILEEGCSGN
jgi:putative intracellular protease/amidase